jgi:Uma2 family endonuclease
MLDLSLIAPERLVKAPLCAGSGVREYWLCDVQANAVEVHRALPRNGGRP